MASLGTGSLVDRFLTGRCRKQMQELVPDEKRDTEDFGAEQGQGHGQSRR